MPEQTSFDPRFDPAFQPGFEDRVAATPRRADRVVEPSSIPPDRVRDEAPMPPSEPVTTSEEEHPAFDRPNPFIRWLWVVGILLTVLGIALYAWTVANNNYSYGGGPVPLHVVVLQTIWVVSPPMITVGLGTIAGLLFWHAARWRPHGD